MSIWRLPHTVIIQLKRFSFRNFIWRDKIDKMVEFPTRFVLNFICFCFQKCTEIKISCIISKVGAMFDVGQKQHTLTKIKHPQVGAMYLVKIFDFLKQPMFTIFDPYILIPTRHVSSYDLNLVLIIYSSPYFDPQIFYGGCISVSISHFTKFNIFKFHCTCFYLMYNGAHITQN